jgi:ABC-2 type transport system ATP-binding protein
VLLLDEPTSGLDPLMEQEFRRCVGEAAARGQTVFLSSHILSEVEQLCARVGILRAGTLVEVATIDRLRAMRSTELDIDIAGEPPISLRSKASPVCRAPPLVSESR